MSEVLENLDTRELDFEDEEEVDFDANYTGTRIWGGGGGRGELQFLNERSGLGKQGLNHASE